MNIELIAKVCHNINKACCESQNDFSQPTWEEAPEWQKSSALNGVQFHLENEVTPEMSHENWLKQKLEEGWVYGKEKDSETKNIHALCDMKSCRSTNVQKTLYLKQL